MVRKNSRKGARNVGGVVRSLVSRMMAKQGVAEKGTFKV